VGKLINIISISVNGRNKIDAVTIIHIGVNERHAIDAILTTPIGVNRINTIDVITIILIPTLNDAYNQCFNKDN
jgi:hypothetical protein